LPKAGERKVEAVKFNAEERSGGGRRGVFEEVRIPVKESDDQTIVVEAIIEGTEAGGSGEIEARLPR
jgi:hypothetical protein